MFSVETLQKLTENTRIRQYSRFLVSLYHARDIGKDVNNNLCVKRKIWLGLKVFIDGFPEVSSGVVTASSSSLDIIIGKLFERGENTGRPRPVASPGILPW